MVYPISEVLLAIATNPLWILSFLTITSFAVVGAAYLIIFREQTVYRWARILRRRTWRCIERLHRKLEPTIDKMFYKMLILSSGSTLVRKINRKGGIMIPKWKARIMLSKNDFDLSKSIELAHWDKGVRATSPIEWRRGNSCWTEFCRISAIACGISINRIAGISCEWCFLSGKIDCDDSMCYNERNIAETIYDEYLEISCDKCQKDKIRELDVLLKNALLMILRKIRQENYGNYVRFTTRKINRLPHERPSALPCDPGPPLDNNLPPVVRRIASKASELQQQYIDERKTKPERSNTE